MLSLLMVFAIFSSPVFGQPGFISLDCGGTENYIDDAGIQWMPDDAYINSGQKLNISNNNPGGKQSRQWNTLRRFPERRKSCYLLTPVEIGRKYLLRGTFVYGNYDNLNSPPQFDLLLDADIWDGFSFSDSSTYAVQKEIIFMANFDPTQVCLARVNESNGLPIISSLELRPLNQSMYWPVNQASSLLRLEYSDFGAQDLDKNIRYPDDPFDRLWSPSVVDFPSITSENKVSMGVAYEQPPSLVMQTAETSYPSSPTTMDLPYRRSSRSGNLYISMYFAELQADLNATDIREFDFFLDNKKLNDAPIQPIYLQSSNISVLVPYGKTDTEAFRLQATNRSTLSPITSALETCRQKTQRPQGTFTTDGFWERIVAYIFRNMHTMNQVNVNLSKKSLTGSIPATISRLTALEIIDLSDNKLNGTIPESLASLTNLKKLDLENNDLTGTVPAGLTSKKNLNLSLSGNVHLCDEGHNYCRRKSSKNGLIIGLAVGGGFVALLIICSILVLLIAEIQEKTMLQAKSPVSPNTQVVIKSICIEYSYEEVKEMTSEFTKQIGGGGYGPVFYGKLENGQEVAVKTSSETSDQGTREFKTEADLLSKVHHKNLVSLLGYCCEGAHRILIYEFMPSGSLHQHLHGTSSSKRCLNWEKRLDIALNAAQGLEYLHSGCKPPIIHRDIKTANILLSERLEAKIADFGLSKDGPTSEVTHVSTNVKGTFGYVDPQYTNTGNLTEKSDVYSFGIVILEIMSGRKPLYTNNSGERVNILSSSKSMICGGDIERLIDKDAGENFHPGAMSKLAGLIMSCTEEQLNDRPNMSHIVSELREALQLHHTVEKGDDGAVVHPN
ncbi:putative leucine-rich repeat receptor-like protein kinase At2g19210 [Cryptomeria japonica]|uniref:putative leucine-rich repeat receptor-like protein kinase At2g19210 n=1 Tax=Cryptomeria japonica TaxID=3369 RepID=UPI0025AD1733|nr:putative leucine-rich repeat receptor-like protein kinase At2g19210 [Cryptomeria japonica]